MGGEWVLGVDFGTTATCVAVCEVPGSPAQLETFGVSGTRVPSCVFLTEEGLVAGTLALNQAHSDLARFAATPKRSLSQGDDVLTLVRPVQVAEAVASVFDLSTAPARQRHANLPGRVIVTHPAVWGEAQLDVLRVAARSSGLPDPELVPEPVAAAWAMVVPERRVAGAHYAIFDWGGGTFDAAVVLWTGDTFELAGPANGVDPLGGEDVDELLRRHVLGQIPDDEQAALRGPSTVRERRDARQLALDIRTSKEALSDPRIPSTLIVVGDQQVAVSRVDLEAIAEPLVARCIDALDSCITSAGLRVADLDLVLLAGDSCRIPLVAKLMTDHLGVEPCAAADAKGSTALGAAAFPQINEARPNPPPPPPAPAPTPPPQRPAQSPFPADWLAAQEHSIRERRTRCLEAVPILARANNPRAAAQMEEWASLCEQALSKFALQRYGLCEETGDAIPRELLEASPLCKTAKASRRFWSIDDETVRKGIPFANGGNSIRAISPHIVDQGISEVYGPFPDFPLHSLLGQWAYHRTGRNGKHTCLIEVRLREDTVAEIEGSNGVPIEETIFAQLVEADHEDALKAHVITGRFLKGSLDWISPHRQAVSDRLPSRVCELGFGLIPYRSGDVRISHKLAIAKVGMVGSARLDDRLISFKITAHDSEFGCPASLDAPNASEICIPILSAVLSSSGM